MKTFPNILNNLIKESLDKFLVKEALSSKVYHFTIRKARKPTYFRMNCE